MAKPNMHVCHINNHGVTINLAHLEMSGQTFIDIVGMPIVHIPSLYVVGMPIVHIPSLYVVGMPIVHIPSLYVNIIIIIDPCLQLNVDLDKLPL